MAPTDGHQDEADYNRSSDKWKALFLLIFRQLVNFVDVFPAEPLTKTILIGGYKVHSVMGYMLDGLSIGRHLRRAWT